MAHLVLTLVLIFVVYIIGYAMGRRDIVNDIREMTKELKEREHELRSDSTDNQ